MANYDRDGSPTETSKLLAGNGEERRGDLGGDKDQPDGESRRFLSHILNYKTYDYVVYMAVATIFLCFPLGIIALLFALRAHNDALAGNYVKAERESWTVWAIAGVAVLIDLLVVVIVLVVKFT